MDMKGPNEGWKGVIAVFAKGKLKPGGKGGRAVGGGFFRISLTLCLLGASLTFWAGAGCTFLGRPPQHIVNALVPLLGIQQVEIPATELGYRRGKLVIRLDFRYFRCGGDDAYSNWWIDLDNTWLRLFDAYPDPQWHSGFEFWCDDLDLHTRYVWNKTTLQLEDWHAHLHGYGVDVNNVPDELEQGHFDEVKDGLVAAVRDEVLKRVDEVLKSQQFSALPVFQADWIGGGREYFYFDCGYEDTSVGENGCPNTGWAWNDRHCFVQGKRKTGSFGTVPFLGLDLGHHYPSLKVTVKAMIERMPGADPNQTFGYISLGPNPFLADRDRKLELKPGMFPQDRKWYYFTITYNGGLLSQMHQFKMEFDFTNQDGVSTGLKWIKVDYVRSHLYDWD